MSGIETVWVCPQDENHIFEEKSKTGLCPSCTEGFSFLEAKRKANYAKEVFQTSSDKPQTQPIIEDLDEKYGRLIIEGDELISMEDYEAAREKFVKALAIFPDREDIQNKIKQCERVPDKVEAPIKTLSTPEGALGLCVLLMDASGSMFQPNAFEGSESNRAQLVAKAAAGGIMSLKGNSMAHQAYLAVYMFDHRVKPIFLKSLAEITTEFDTEAKLEQFLYATMENEMGGETDINGALQMAHNLVSEFLNQEMKAFRKPRGDKDYPIIIRPVTNRKTMQQVEVPNVRVFMYTDGIQYVDGESKALINPFKQGGGLPNNQVDILLGAFIGESLSEGCREIKAILSDCPEHDSMQFFLIETPEGVVELSGVFRMASGNSGFCKECIKKDRNQKDHIIETFGDLNLDDLL